MRSQNLTPLLNWMCYPLSGFVGAKRTSLKWMVQQKKLKSTEKKFLYSIFEHRTNCNKRTAMFNECEFSYFSRLVIYVLV